MTRIWSGVAVLEMIVGSWVALALLGVAIEGPSRSFVEWIGRTGGPWAILACIAGAFLILTLVQKAFERRDRDRQFATDRTIYVEPSRRTLAFKRRLAWLCLPIVLVLGKIIVDTVLL